MGSCNFKSDSPDTENSNHNIVILSKSFKFLFKVGKGGFGKVWKVQHRRTHEYFALKEMSKIRIISRHSVSSVINERYILSNLKHPLIVNMHCSFQDLHNLYLILDFMEGGDLRFHLSRYRSFPETHSKFFIACIVLGIEYLHSNNILHRDLKPENLVLDRKGYLHITDFGVARFYRENNKNETSGTPGYMAPEVLFHKNHGKPADYFALGIIAYELMTGSRPYLGNNRKEIRDAIIQKQVQVHPSNIPLGWSPKVCDFINQLLHRKPDNRLGNKGIEDIKNHPWLSDINWEKLVNKELNAPFVPPNKENFDSRVINKNWADELEKVNLYSESVQCLFEGYSCYLNRSESFIVSVSTEAVVRPANFISTKLTN